MNAALFPDLVVNGETVPHALVASEAQNQTAPKGKPGIAWRKAANAVAIRTLLLQEAKQQGIKADAAEVAPGRFETAEEALIRGLLDANIDPEAP
ncbi:MAG: peptidase, partial [Paracoccaceae bacterium]